MLNYQFNSSYAGRRAFFPEGGFTLFERDGVPMFGGVSVEYNGQNYDEAVYRLTGWTLVKNGTYYYQSVNGQWCKWTDGASMLQESAPQYGSSTVYNMINKLIANNKRILENNLLCAKYADHLTVSEQQTLYDLQTRLQNRDAMLRNKNIIESAQTSYPKGYATWSEYLEGFMANGRVGAIGTIAVIVVAVVVIASLISAAYWAYKYYYDQSVQDVKFSDSLTKTLSQKLTAQEYEQLKQETAGMITKAKLSERLSGFGSGLKYAAIGLGLVLVAKVLIPGKESESKTSKRRTKA